MLLDRGKQKQRTLVITGLSLIAAVIAMVLFISREPSEEALKKNKDRAEITAKGKEAAPEDQKVVITREIKKEVPIDYKELEENQTLNTMMTDRKNSLGIKESLDMIVKSNESFTVGKSTVSMQKILEKAFANDGKVFEEEIAESGSLKPAQIKEYGIYVVQPGDNIWNIHFRILKDYYTSKGISVEEKADEPGSQGMSSGVGKILKFSETMVIIYNLIEDQVTQDINIIDPLSKVVVYNMDAVFSLLEEIDYSNVDRLQFDGKNIWIPVKKI